MDGLPWAVLVMDQADFRADFRADFPALVAHLKDPNLSVDLAAVTYLQHHNNTTLQHRCDDIMAAKAAAITGLTHSIANLTA